jgi:hypothetical protein
MFTLVAPVQVHCATWLPGATDAQTEGTGLVIFKLGSGFKVSLNDTTAIAFVPQSE